MRNTVTGLLAIPAALLTAIFATPAYSQDWPYNLPPGAKYYPEHEHRIRRDLEIQQKLNLTSPCGMRKMSDDEGEKFFLDYWQFDQQAFDSIEMDKPLHARRSVSSAARLLNISNVEELLPPLLLHAESQQFISNHRFFGRYWMRICINRYNYYYAANSYCNYCKLCCIAARIDLHYDDHSSGYNFWERHDNDSRWNDDHPSIFGRVDNIVDFLDTDEPFAFSNNPTANHLHHAPSSMRDPDPNSNKSHNKQQTSAQPPRFGILQFQASDDVKRLAVAWKTELASMSSSVLSTFIAFPLDFAKVRMQSYDTKFFPTVKDAYQVEGLRGFWRGVGTPMASVTLVRTISFSLYQRSKYVVDYYMTQMTGKSPLELANKKGQSPTLSTIACFSSAGAIAGAVITCVSCPFELIKLNAQLAGKMKREANPSDRPQPISDLRTGAFRTAQQLVRDRGIRGLYCGYRLHLIRDTLGTAIYFGTYETVKQILSNARGNGPAEPAAVALAGATCGIVSWVMIYPLDVVKTQYQKRQLEGGPA
ncbi:hypothetical protein KCV05_g15656, partial [Aureobasidium melanogenum]